MIFTSKWKFELSIFLVSSLVPYRCISVRLLAGVLTCHWLPACRLQRICCGWLCAPLVVCAVTTLLYLRVSYCSLFLLLLNHAPFTALITSDFPFIPAEFAFLCSALVRFLEFLSVSVSLLGREQEKSTRAHKKRKRDKWLFNSLRAVVFSPHLFFRVSPASDLIVYYVVTSLFTAVLRRYCFFLKHKLNILQLMCTF